MNKDMEVLELASVAQDNYLLIFQSIRKVDWHRFPEQMIKEAKA